MTLVGAPYSCTSSPFYSVKSSFRCIDDEYLTVGAVLERGSKIAVTAYFIVAFKVIVRRHIKFKADIVEMGWVGGVCDV